MQVLLGVVVVISHGRIGDSLELVNLFEVAHAGAD